MAHEITDQVVSPKFDQSSDAIDPKSQLHLKMRALGFRGKSLGKVETFERDGATGQLSALVIRHGMFGNKLTSVAATRVKWVNTDSVILDLSPAAFKKLPQMSAN